MSDEKNSSETKLTLFSFIGSLFAAGFGVQSNANRERDFKQGKFSHFIIGGVVFVILFILVLVAVVQFVLSNVAG